MLLVRDLMLVDVATVTPATPIREAVALIREKRHRQLPVLENGKLVGIITDRDICLVIRTPVAAEMTVGDCMTGDPITVSPDTPAHRAAQMLSTYKFGALPVVENDRLIGIITGVQILQFFAKSSETKTAKE